MAKHSNPKEQRILLAYLAAGLFALAGLIEILVGFARDFSATTPQGSIHGSGMLAVGSMFLTLGGLWGSIASRWKKAAAKDRV